MPVEHAEERRAPIERPAEVGHDRHDAALPGDGTGAGERSAERRRTDRWPLGLAAERAEQAEQAEPTPETSAADQARILESLAKLHEAYDRGDMSLDDFEARRDQLTSSLQI